MSSRSQCWQDPISLVNEHGGTEHGAGYDGNYYYLVLQNLPDAPQLEAGCFYSQCHSKNAFGRNLGHAEQFVQCSRCSRSVYLRTVCHPVRAPLPYDGHTGNRFMLEEGRGGRVGVLCFRIVCHPVREFLAYGDHTGNRILRWGGGGGGGGGRGGGGAGALQSSLPSCARSLPYGGHAGNRVVLEEGHEDVWNGLCG